MRYRQLGRSGLTVSVVGLGCNNFGGRLDARASADVVHAALELGVTLFDTAEIYGGDHGPSEEFLGAALRGHRDEVVIATKFGFVRGARALPKWEAPGSRRYVRAAVEASLRRLGTDRIDLYQMHSPDPATPIGETLDALADLVREGKVRYVGSSNFAAWQVADADWVARSAGVPRFVSAQNRYNLLERGAECELVPACEHLGVGVLPFYPLGAGLLTGKYHRGQPSPEGTRISTSKRELLESADWDRLEALEAFASANGRQVLDAAVAGLASRPGVGSVIAGAMTPDQVRANVVAGEWELSADESAALEGALS